MDSSFPPFGSEAAPRGQGWPGALLILHATADGILTAALIAIPALLLYVFLRPHRRGSALSALTVLVSLALLALGLTHLAGLIGLWVPLAGTEGVLKAIAAALSLVLAALLFMRLATLSREPDDLLEAEIAAHLLTKAELTEVRAQLKECVESHAKELNEAEQRLEIALRNSPISVFTQDREMRFTWVHNAPAGLSDEAILGKRDDEVLPAAAAAEIMDVKRTVIENGETHELEANFELNGQPWSLYLLVEPLRDEVGEIVGTIAVSVDVTHRKAQELQLRILLRELTHRSKNLLAVINAIARQTAARTQSVDEFLSAFNARLVAIGCAHDLLVADDWRGASLKDLIEAQLFTHASNRSDQIEIGGEDVMLKPDAVQNVGLALHELFTNAQKWGALSTDKGQVQVRWERRRPMEDGVKLIWAESGGPTVPRPEQIGFGRTMIENVVGKALNGSVDLSFDPAGVRCEIVIPRSQLALVAEEGEAGGVRTGSA